MDLTNLPFDEFELESIILRHFSPDGRLQNDALEEELAEHGWHFLDNGVSRYVYSKGEYVLKVPARRARAADNRAEVSAWSRVKRYRRVSRHFMPTRFIGTHELVSVAPKLRVSHNDGWMRSEEYRKLGRRFGVQDTHGGNLAYGQDGHLKFIDLGFGKWSGLDKDDWLDNGWPEHRSWARG